MSQTNLTRIISEAIFKDYCATSYDLIPLQKGQEEAEKQLRQEGNMPLSRPFLTRRLNSIFAGEQELSDEDYFQRAWNLGRGYSRKTNLKADLHEIALAAYIKEEAVKEGLLEKVSRDDCYFYVRAELSSLQPMLEK